MPLAVGMLRSNLGIVHTLLYAVYMAVPLDRKELCAPNQPTTTV